MAAKTDLRSSGSQKHDNVALHMLAALADCRSQKKSSCPSSIISHELFAQTRLSTRSRLSCSLGKHGGCGGGEFGDAGSLRAAGDIELRRGSVRPRWPPHLSRPPRQRLCRPPLHCDDTHCTHAAQASVSLASIPALIVSRPFAMMARDDIEKSSTVGWGNGKGSTLALFCSSGMVLIAF